MSRNQLEFPTGRKKYIDKLMGLLYNEVVAIMGNNGSFEGSAPSALISIVELL